MKIIMILAATAVFEINGFTITQNIYCKILGNNDASAQHTEAFKQALSDLGAKDTTIPIKQMGAIGPVIAMQNLTSFTANGIWINEEHYNKLLQENKDLYDFLVLHETAHYIKGHHKFLLKNILLKSTTALVTLYLLSKCHKHVFNKDLPSQHKLIASALTVAALGLTMPKYVQHQEVEADIYAAAALHKKNPTALIRLIKHLKNQTYDYKFLWYWWPKKEEQIKYLEEIVIKDYLRKRYFGPDYP